MLLGVVIVTAATGVVYMLYCYVLYPALLSPLAKIPSAHWSCSISDIWLKLVRIKDAELDVLQGKHRHFGAVIRVGPSSLSICGMDDIRMVYQAEFPKASMYTTSDNYGCSCLMSTVDQEESNIRRRILSKVYSNTFTHSSTAVQAQLHVLIFDRLVPMLKREEEHSDRRGTQVEPIAMAAIVDSMSGHIFGMDNSTNFVLDKGARNDWLTLFYKIADRMVWVREFPIIPEICGRLGIRLDSSLADDALDAIELWNKDMADRAIRSLEKPSGINRPENEPVVVGALRSGYQSEANKPHSPFFGISEQEQETLVASETMDEVLASQDPATTLTYLLWYLASSPSVQEQLREELRTSAPSLKATHSTARMLPEPKVLDSLPILNAVVKETLRRHPPLPYAERRIVPQPWCLIGGYEIPGGTQVAASPYIVHGDEEAFPDPTRWDHSRWLGEAYGTERHQKMDQHFWAWSSGRRGCIATAFVTNQLKFITAAIVANFELSLAGGSGLKMNYTTMTTTGDGLLLRFKSL